MRRIFETIGIIALAFGMTYLFNNAVTDEPTDLNTQKEFNNEYRVYALNLPEQVNFAGEELPLNDPDVHERLDRELLVNTYWQSNTLLMFKRAHKHFPMIEEVLREYGVPEDFKYLALIESGLLNVTSPAGAKGFWQLMPHTARENGLEVNRNIDERYNARLSTEVACKYLLKAKEKFGSWTLAAASYNMGISGVQKQLTRQKIDNYYDLLLNPETARYIFRITALKMIYENPKEYGFYFREKDLYQSIRVTNEMVDYPVENFAEWAQERNVSYKMLKIHNPWLRENKLNNKTKKKYYIELPLPGQYPYGEMASDSLKMSAE